MRGLENHKTKISRAGGSYSGSNRSLTLPHPAVTETRTARVKNRHGKSARERFPKPGGRVLQLIVESGEPSVTGRQKYHLRRQQH